jgi:hypothetical protein
VKSSRSKIAHISGVSRRLTSANNPPRKRQRALLGSRQAPPALVFARTVWGDRGGDRERSEEGADLGRSHLEHESMVLSSSEVIPGNSELRETRVQREARISPRLNAYAKPRPMTSGWLTVSPSWPRLPIRSTGCSSMFQRSSRAYSGAMPLRGRPSRGREAVN